MEIYEAKKKAAKIALLRTVILIAIVGVIFIVVGAIVAVRNVIGGFIIFLGVGEMVGIIPVYYYKNKQIKRSFCPKCSYNYNYKNDISWAEDSIEEKDRKVVSTLDFSCQCRNCGEEVKFIKKFTTAEYIENKGWKQYNVANAARKYFIDQNEKIRFFL